MLNLEEEKPKDICKFQWGKKRGVGGKNRSAQFYESFKYDDEEYFLYDCVYMYKEDEPEPYIGKLIKIWEQPPQKRKVKVLWFFRPIEIQNWLGEDDTIEKEIFLAVGEGLGLTNINPVEVIAGRCNVICTSKDHRNPQPSEEDLKIADFIFYRGFDVGKFTISDQIEDMIAGVEVKYIFNRMPLIHPKVLTLQVNGKVQENKKMTPGSDNSQQTPMENSLLEGTLDNRPPKKMKLDDKEKNGANMQQLKADSIKDERRFLNFFDKAMDDRVKEKTAKDSDLRMSQEKMLLKKEKHPEKSTKLSDGLLNKASSPTIGEKVEVTKRPENERSKWFKGLPWDERIQTAREQGTLVLLENLDPSYSSSQVEDIVWHGFREICSARMIQRSTFSSPHCGQALVVFKTKEAASMAIKKLEEGCLMLPNGRPLLGCTEHPHVMEKSSKFVGHLFIDKIRLQMQREEMKKAVSTSHYSQPNTIEYEMAMEWRLLQEKADAWWRELYKKHDEELKNVKSNLKIK